MCVLKKLKKEMQVVCHDWVTEKAEKNVRILSVGLEEKGEGTDWKSWWQ